MKRQCKVTNSTRDWEMGITADRIKAALYGFNADALPGGYYRLTKINEDLANIATSVGVDVALRLPSEKELHKLKYEIDHAFPI